MDFFNSDKFTNFLNTTQTGSAHSSHGIDFPIFMQTLFTSICFCTIQLTLFCLLRSIFNYLYQPRCFCVPINERMEILPRGFIKWIIPTLQSSINTYLSLGLDAYFFVRFISVLSLFFLLIGSLNMIILIPINFTGNSIEFTAAGLDKLSLSNIANSNVSRLNAHFIMGLLTIGVFHWLIIYEFQSFVIIKQSYLLSESHKNSIMARTLLIFNVPHYLQDEQVLRDLFQFVPGGVTHIWHVCDFEKIDHQVEKAKDALNLLEKSQILALKGYYCSISLLWQKKEQQNDALYRVKKDIKFFPPIYCRMIKFPQIDRSLRLKLPGWLRLFALQKRVSMLNWALETLQECHLKIDEEKLKLANGQLSKHNKIFIEFQDHKGACIANQCLLSQSQGCFDKTLIEVHPQDIIWRNISRTDGIGCKFEKYIVTILFISIIVLYVIPVSLIHSLSQIPLLIHLMPFLKWIYQFPEEARQTISGFLPSILLTILTEFVMITFRFLTYFKGKATGSEVELDLQKWFFAFLFVQQFLVVTISSSVTVICKQIIDQPTSIPVLLATNLPKSATFFFQYICLRAFAFCGNNFLRITQLALTNSYYKIVDITPRQKFNRITALPQIQWGTTFAVYSIYACIGISYSIVSPLISIFIIFFLNLSILYYKYALKYVYSHINTSETMGRLYPIALLHLFTGIYCLECCLIGVFFLSKDSSGKYVMRIQGWIMTGVLFFTIFANTLIYNRYLPYFSDLPILSDKLYKDEKKCESSSTPVNSTINSSTNHEFLYLHPAFKYEKPKIWLPKDPKGFSNLQIEEIQSRSAAIKGATSGAEVQVGKFLKTLKMHISEAPPDYK
ncbi:SPO75 [Candida oxycetoniae]|uniref:SPO75 n=1 Tax=Candida oxycetoniae TaxID=497107 RepID=A0AAI9WYW3_9ASCO|nr:SPO75 [Candida oxycetoniae]KAI3405558.2 SPO75 [Candida oxycetoniae]